MMSSDRMFLLNEIHQYKARLNLVSDLIKDVDTELLSLNINGLNADEKMKIRKIREYAKDLSDFARVR